MGTRAEEGKLRTIKREIETNSATIEKIVDQLVGKYNEDLDKCIDEARELLDTKDKLTDYEIENITLRVPVYMYYGVHGVETLGIQLDNAKAIKTTKYNEYYMDAQGTIGDKTAEAENLVIPEHLMVVCYERAYKKLKAKVDVATQICQATRKVLTKRIAEIDVSKNDRNA